MKKSFIASGPGQLNEQILLSKSRRVISYREASRKSQKLFLQKMGDKHGDIPIHCKHLKSTLSFVFSCRICSRVTPVK